MDPDRSQTRSSDEDDEFEEDDEAYEDDEGTLDEEESHLHGDDEDDEDNADELRLLAEEGEMSVEELRRKYMGDASGSENDAGPSSSSATRGDNGTTLGATTAVGYFTEEALREDDEDEEYSPPPEPWKKVVRVGPEYQVPILPRYRRHFSAKNGSLSSSSYVSSEDDKYAQALWLNSTELCSQAEVEKYLLVCEKIRQNATSTASPNSPAKSTIVKSPPFDDENALYALLQANYDVKKAKAMAPFDLSTSKCINGARLTYKEPWKPMDNEECDLFEEGLRTFGKNFWAISREKLISRTPGELVRFYYIWKKTERHDVFVEKSKELAQGQRTMFESADTTDFMGNIMDMLNGGGRPDSKSPVQVVADSEDARSQHKQSQQQQHQISASYAASHLLSARTATSSKEKEWQHSSSHCSQSIVSSTTKKNLHE